MIGDGSNPSSIRPHTNPPLLHIKHHSYTPEKSLTQYPDIFKPTLKPLLFIRHASTLDYTAYTVTRTIGEFSKTESATCWAIDSVRGGAFTVHSREIPAADLEGDIDVV